MDAGTKKILGWTGGIIISALVITWIIRNRFLVKTQDTGVLDINTPFDRVVAMGAIPGTDRQGASVARYNNYVFYTNNRAFLFGADKKISKRGTMDHQKINWDGGGSTELTQIFA